MAERCPLCQGKVIDGRCKECGYDIPDEYELESIGSIYNGEPMKSEINAVGYADPYMPSIQDVPKIEVVQEQQWHQYNPQKSRWQQPTQQNVNPNQQVNNTQNQQNPYQQQYYNQNQPQQNNPQQYYYQNQNQVQQGNQLQPNQWQNGANRNYVNNNSPYTNNNISTNSGKGAFARFWWMFLLALILPFPAGFIFFAVLRKDSDDAVKRLAFPMLGVTVLRLIFGLAITSL